jgi:predicted DNA-binding transcriptional regulator AlpA
MAEKELLSQRQVAQIFGISERTLEGLRQRRLGPPYVKLGKLVRYDPIAIDRFLQANTIEPRITGGADAR